MAPATSHTAEFFINNSTEGNENGPQAAAQRRKIELDKLDQMKNYCFTSGCLRHYILEYFGEDSPARCDNCGNCRARKNIAAALRAPASRPQKLERSLYEMLRSVRTDFAEKGRTAAGADLYGSEPAGHGSIQAPKRA